MSTELVAARDKNVAWYTPEKDFPLSELSPETKEVLENYSKIPEDLILPHVLKVRDDAWEVFPYPCIGQFHFLDLSIRKGLNYDEVLRRVKDEGQTYLDLGCCFGQDIRSLVVDGADPTHLYGSDREEKFWDIGHELFKDKDTLKTEFIAADVFDENSGLSKLDGKIDIIHAAHFFHLFDWDKQVAVAKRMVKLLKSQQGSMAIGRHIGNVNPGTFQKRSNSFMYRHDASTFQKLWAQVGAETDTKWSVEAVSEWKEEWSKHLRANASVITEGVRLIRFVVRRVE